MEGSTVHADYINHTLFFLQVVTEVKAIAGGKPPGKVTETEGYCLIL